MMKIKVKSINFEKLQRGTRARLAWTTVSEPPGTPRRRPSARAQRFFRASMPAPPWHGYSGPGIPETVKSSRIFRMIWTPRFRILENVGQLTQ